MQHHAYISSRPTRAVANRFAALIDELGANLPPDYPIAYDAGKALHPLPRRAACMASVRIALGWVDHLSGLCRPGDELQRDKLISVDMEGVVALLAA